MKIKFITSCKLLILASCFSLFFKTNSSDSITTFANYASSAINLTGSILSTIPLFAVLYGGFSFYKPIFSGLSDYVLENKVVEKDGKTTTTESKIKSAGSNILALGAAGLTFYFLFKNKFSISGQSEHIRDEVIKNDTRFQLIANKLKYNPNNKYLLDEYDAAKKSLKINSDNHYYKVEDQYIPIQPKTTYDQMIDPLKNLLNKFKSENKLNNHKKTIEII
jgi:hypothetical protein